MYCILFQLHPCKRKKNIYYCTFRFTHENTPQINLCIFSKFQYTIFVENRTVVKDIYNAKYSRVALVVVLGRIEDIAVICGGFIRPTERLSREFRSSETKLGTVGKKDQNDGKMGEFLKKK